MANNNTEGSALWECGSECRDKVIRLIEKFNETRGVITEAFKEVAGDMFPFIIKLDELLECANGTIEDFHLYKSGADWCPNTLWINGNESLNVESIAAVTMLAQRESWTDKIFAITYAHICSKPRIDEFGGGALIVYEGKAHFMSTITWANDMIEELTGE